MPEGNNSTAGYLARKIRSSNIEIRNKLELTNRRNHRNETQQVELFRISLPLTFGIVSIFGFRISSFRPIRAIRVTCRAVASAEADPRIINGLKNNEEVRQFRYIPSVKLLLIDGHYYVYRSFFAIQNLSNSRGEPTNAIYGFTKTVRRMLKDLRPEYGAVVWDEGLPQRRTELQPAYKETRKEMPQPMVPQLDFIQKLTPSLGFRNISLPNTEADDLIGCYAVAAGQRGWEVVLATNDKDLFQLVNPNVKIYTTAKADLVSPKDAFALLGEAEVIAKWNVPPQQIGDVLAIAGDSVDNIPGAGIGRKAAAALIREHGGLEALLNNLDQVKNQRSRDKLLAARGQILQNRKMVELECSTELPVSLDALRITPDYPALLEALEKCEFKSLLQEVRDEASKAGTARQSEFLL